MKDAGKTDPMDTSWTLKYERATMDDLADAWRAAQKSTPYRATKKGLEDRVHVLEALINDVERIEFRVITLERIMREILEALTEGAK